MGALDKEIRLSFAQRIKGTLPDPYHALIPEGKEKDTPDFKYASDSKSATLFVDWSTLWTLMNPSNTVRQGRQANYGTHPQESS